ncbi:MAG: hypothetical protein WA151_03330 [Desulfatirhabdiaceae bacterium]
MRPSNLILRCYGYRSNGKWYGVCLDFNLAAEAVSPEDMKNKICDMIESYIETVIDTDDMDSISDLMSRRAPIKDWIIYYLFQIASGLKDLPGKILFRPTIPFRLVGHF